ncbi:hypothetical protein ALC60_13585 [Trachymyrmex zeteki]|uniref:Uncharacterized protein n=1 Tax=Mycetomoellerius zeteki TaxID=64791 RepID=A0A151WI21_9HYME|nr:hypothetical protein ALC60_13585 [Trachymyrmex zeteki]
MINSHAGYRSSAITENEIERGTLLPKYLNSEFIAEGYRHADIFLIIMFLYAHFFTKCCHLAESRTEKEKGVDKKQVGKVSAERNQQRGILIKISRNFAISKLLRILSKSSKL